MKNNFLLPLLVLLGSTAAAQEVLKIQGGALITLQPGAEITVAGGISLDAGSSLINNGVFTIRQNGASGAANFYDNSFTSYDYGTGKFVFNSIGKQILRSPNSFGRIDVMNAGLTITGDITARKWRLSTGIVTTGNFRAVVAGTAATDLDASPANAGFTQSWINGKLRRYINPALADSYLFPIGDTVVPHSAGLERLNNNPLTGVSYIDAFFGPKKGNDSGLNVIENGSPYLSVNNRGVWHFTPNVAPGSGAFDLKLFLDGFTGLADNGFASLQRPDQSASAADWQVPAGSGINFPGGPGRLVADGYALRKDIGSFGQFGIGATAPAVQGTGLQGVYYNGGSLSGTPLLTRIDPTINFELTYSHQPLSPAPGIVPEDNYSVRWSGKVAPQYSETYTFYTVGDDGVRLWVNGVKLVDNWVNQSATEKTGNITLVAGQQYDIVLEYYENTGEAVTKLLWSSTSTPKAIVPQSQLYPSPGATPAPGSGTGLQGVYYNGTALTGTPLLNRVDPAINFELTYSHQPLSPAPGIVPEDNYSVRWSGKVAPQYSETYTFYTVGDDGVRLWVNGVKLVDNWVNQSATEKSGNITLVAGQQYDIVLEYYENTGEAVTKLLWSSISTPKEIVPQSQLYPSVGNTRLLDTGMVSTSVRLPEKSDGYTATTAAVIPNPVKRGQPARLQINCNRSATTVIMVSSSNGTTISNRRINLLKGINTVTFNTGDLPQGLYLVGIIDGYKSLTVKLIIE